MSLADDDLQLIAMSFLDVAAAPSRAGAAFYARLFEIAPRARALFRADLDAQAAKLIATLAHVVSHLQRREDAGPMLRDLAVRHVAYGVRREDYGAVGAALIAMLAEVAGDGWSPAAQAAWTRAYDDISALMIAAAYPPPPAASS